MASEGRRNSTHESYVRRDAAAARETQIERLHPVEHPSRSKLLTLVASSRLLRCRRRRAKSKIPPFRIATGCHKNSPVEHLHTEAKFPLVKDHLEMLLSQHLASALRPTHPSHAIATAPHGPCSMKETPGHKCEAAVAPYLSNGVIDSAEYRS